MEGGRCGRRALPFWETPRQRIARRGLPCWSGVEGRLWFDSAPFVPCGLPMRCPPRGPLVQEPRERQRTLELAGRPDDGLRFGQDRLIRIFLATLAVRWKSHTLRCRSGAEIRELFGRQKGGKESSRSVAGR